MPAQITLTIRTRAAVQDLPKVMHKAYSSIVQHLEELGEQPSGPGYAAYHNMDMQNLDVEIGFPVSKELTGKREIKMSEIPSGRYATCIHTGPYSKIEPAYSSLMKWISEKGYEAIGVSYELYLNDPDITPPEKLHTKILFPLK
jgi:effector-binding domain-containing protein